MTARLLALQNIRKYCHQQNRESHRLDLAILKDFTITMQSISMVSCPVGSCLSAMFGLKYFVFNSLDGENNYHWS